MPNRILRDWTDSLRFDGLTADAERLFVRLLMKADDYGRYHANPRLVKAGCFPLSENLRANTVAAWLTELSDRLLVFCYTSGTGEYLVIPKFGQRMKQSRPKFPPPDGRPPDWLPDSTDFPELQGTSGNFRLDSETETETEVPHSQSAQAHDAGGCWPDPGEYPTLDEVQAWARSVMAPPECAEKWHAERVAEGWQSRHGRPLSIQRGALSALFRTYATAWKANDARKHQATAKPIRPADLSDVDPRKIKEL